MKVRKRTLAREIALQFLYQYDVWQGMAHHPSLADNPPDSEEFIRSSTSDSRVREFARILCTGAVDGLETADRLIAEATERWKLERLAMIDRAILRLSIFELNELPEVPARVVLNEAIELAKKYSTAQSGAFVNGILDHLLFLRGGEVTPGKPVEPGKRE